MKYFVLILFIISSLLAVGCTGEKTAENVPLTKADTMNTNQSSTATNNPVARVEQEAQAAAQAQAGASGSEAKKVTIPSFLDMSKGGIVDLPAYKDARLFNIQYGPINGVDSAMIIYMTRDPFEKVAAYYDKVIKSQGWTIGKNFRDPESVEISMTKGERDEALLRIKKNNETKQTEILISRSQQPAAAKPQ